MFEYLGYFDSSFCVESGSISRYLTTQIKHTQHTNQSPEFLLEEKEFQEQLERAIAALSEDVRTVFLMNRIDKLTYKKIAERLDISIKTVEKRMHKALISLRKLPKKI